jgi:NADH:ubiquinone oxidoreductase subunit K
MSDFVNYFTGNLGPFQIKLFLIAIVALFIIGIYTIIATRNLIRTLLGLELTTKAVTLLFILIGFLSGRTGIAQALVITVIIIEVVVIAIAAGLVLGVFRHHHSLDTRNLRNMKG